MGLNHQDAKKMRECNRRLTQIRKISHKDAQEAQEGDIKILLIGLIGLIRPIRWTLRLT
jgi:hypothetical protein